MTNPFQQSDWEAQLSGIQLPFFGKRFLAAARRSRAISKSSLPSLPRSNSAISAGPFGPSRLTCFSQRRRRHMASNSVRCSSDMRMLNWSVFFATPRACQTRILNSWGNMIDNGIHCYNKCRANVSPEVAENIWTKRGIMPQDFIVR